MLAKTDEGRQESTRVQALANCLAASSYQSHCLFYASFDFFDIQRWLNSCPLSNLFSLIKYNLIALTEFEILLVLDLTFLQSVNKKTRFLRGRVESRLVYVGIMMFFRGINYKTIFTNHL